MPIAGAGALLYREIMYGPEALEEFVSCMQEIDFAELDEFSEGAFIDFDSKTMCWSGQLEGPRIPKVSEVYDRMLSCSWPGFTIETGDEGVDFINGSIAKTIRDDDDEDDEEDDYLLDDRIATVRDAMQEDMDEEDERAWIVIVDGNDKTRHRCLPQLPQQFINPGARLAKEIAAMRPTEIPSEKVTAEGAVINIPQRSLSVWGDPHLKSLMKQLQASWKGWTVDWLDNGYLDQCRIACVEPIRMSDAEALAQFMPQLISNKRFDMSTFVGAIGGSLKSKALAAVGCIYVLICIPILIFAVFSGLWMAALITMLVTLIIFATLFKLVEYRLKNKFGKVLPANKMRTAEDDDQPEVAGPPDIQSRESRVAELLAAAGLPALSEIKPYYPDPEEYQMLYQ